MPSGVYPSDQPAHAGAGDVVHRYVMFLKPGDNPNVGEPEGPTALENETDRGTPSSPSRWSVLRSAAEVSPLQQNANGRVRCAC